MQRLGVAGLLGLCLGLTLVAGGCDDDRPVRDSMVGVPTGGTAPEGGAMGYGGAAPMAGMPSAGGVPTGGTPSMAGSAEMGGSLGGSPNTGGTAGEMPDVGGMPMTGGAPEMGGMAMVPLIDEALGQECPDGGNPGPFPNSTTRGNQDLHRLTLDDPTAVCNDGSPALLFVRSAVETSTRWVFFLQGGSGCADHRACRERWCGQQGGYDASKMSSRFIDAPAIGGTGILNPQARNPYHDANIVFVYYCSSDQWTGRQSDVVLSGEGEDGDYRIHFRGHSILEAMVARLRRGETTSDDDMVTLPDLDDAREILWTGVSAGGAGATHNLDWFAGHFDATQTRVSGVIDAGFGPTFDQFSPETETAFLAFAQTRYGDAWVPFYDPFLDTSCVAHAANQGENAWRCSDPTYVKLNHVTTRFFQRLDLRDSVGSSGAISLGATLEEYAAGAAHSLGLLSQIGETAHEAGAITTVPGAYGPNCARHVAITDGSFFFQSTVEDANGRPASFAGALGRWLGGEPVRIIDAPLPDDGTSVCGPREGNGN